MTLLPDKAENLRIVNPPPPQTLSGLLSQPISIFSALEMVLPIVCVCVRVRVRVRVCVRVCGRAGGRVCALVAQLCRLFMTLRTVAHQAPLSMGFSRQEYWSGLPWADTIAPLQGIPAKEIFSLWNGERNLRLHLYFLCQWSQPFWHQGPVLWKTPV